MKSEIIKDLESRYTTKKYEVGKKIPEDKLEVLFEAMRLSASSINSQPWKFLILESDEAKQKMHNTFAKKFQFNQPHILASSAIILFAHKTHYTRDDYAKVVDKHIEDKRLDLENRESGFASFVFSELNTDENGDTSAWTKNQVYLALGNTLHTLARLEIDSTTMEGVDSELISKEFESELEGYKCEVALVMGYHHPTEDFNARLPKSRLSMESVLERL